MASRKVWEQREARWQALYGRTPSRPLSQEARDRAQRDVRGGHDCVDHQWVDGRCGICHESEPKAHVCRETLKYDGPEGTEYECKGCETSRWIPRKD